MNNNSLLAYRYSNAISHLNSALPYIDHKERQQINKLINNYTLLIDQLNNDEFLIHNPTDNELKIINRVLKQVVKGYYLNPIAKLPYYSTFTNELDDLLELTFTQCDKTIIDDFIINAKIYISRNVKNCHSRNKLQQEYNDHLNLLMLECFQKQNWSFIQEHLLITEIL
jgi:hypothetical protein